MAGEPDEIQAEPTDPVAPETVETPPAVEAPKLTPFDAVAEHNPGLTVAQTKVAAGYLEANPNLTPAQALLLAKAEKADMFKPQTGAPSKPSINPTTTAAASPAPSRPAVTLRAPEVSPQEAAMQEVETASEALLACRSQSGVVRHRLAVTLMEARRKAGLVHFANAPKS